MKTKMKSKLKSSDKGGQINLTKKKKKVTFQMPEEVVEPEGAKEDDVDVDVDMEDSQAIDVDEYNWKNDHLRPGMEYGYYSAEEDKALRQAVCKYIRENGWDQEEGLQKVLNPVKHADARGCWLEIRKALPNRTIKRLNSRAQRLLSSGNYLGKWSSEETGFLIELHNLHGNNWKKIAEGLARDPASCKEKWRNLKCTKKGTWSHEELGILCELVFKCLDVQKRMAEAGTIKKTNLHVRDNINWTFIAEHLEGRAHSECLSVWYSRCASPMVSSGDWSNNDDQLLLQKIMEQFALSEELVDWDSLLEHRSGEICKKRWDQMQQSLGRGPQQRANFVDKMELLVKRYAPYLLDEELDQEFVSELQAADARQDEVGKE